jgi:hypothetical protein
MLWFYCAFLAQTSLHLIPTAKSSEQQAFLQPSYRTVLHHHPFVSGSHLVPFAKFDDGGSMLKNRQCLHERLNGDLPENHNPFSFILYMKYIN